MTRIGNEGGRAQRLGGAADDDDRRVVGRCPRVVRAEVLRQRVHQALGRPVGRQQRQPVPYGIERAVGVPAFADSVGEHHQGVAGEEGHADGRRQPVVQGAHAERQGGLGLDRADPSARLDQQRRLVPEVDDVDAVAVVAVPAVVAVTAAPAVLEGPAVLVGPAAVLVEVQQQGGREHVLRGVVGPGVARPHVVALHRDLQAPGDLLSRSVVSTANMARGTSSVARRQSCPVWSPAKGARSHCRSTRSGPRPCGAAETAPARVLSGRLRGSRRPGRRTPGGELVVVMVLLSVRRRCGVRKGRRSGPPRGSGHGTNGPGTGAVRPGCGAPRAEEDA